jgi:hypothetical protein
MKNSLSNRFYLHLLRSQPTLCYFGVDWRCFSHALALFPRQGSAERVFGVASWKFLFFFFEKKTLRTDIFVPSFYINMILVNIIIIISPLFVKSILLIKDIYPGGIRP